MRASVARIGPCGQLAFECQTRALAYAVSCLERARPSVRACRDLPGVGSRAALTKYAGEVCRELGPASIQACTQVLTALQQYCASPARAKKLSVATSSVGTSTVEAAP